MATTLLVMNYLLLSPQEKIWCQLLKPVITEVWSMVSPPSSIPTTEEWSSYWAVVFGDLVVSWNLLREKNLCLVSLGSFQDLKPILQWYRALTKALPLSRLFECTGLLGSNLAPVLLAQLTDAWFICSFNVALVSIKRYLWILIPC